MIKVNVPLLDAILRVTYMPILNMPLIKKDLSDDNFRGSED